MVIHDDSPSACGKSVHHQPGYSGEGLSLGTAGLTWIDPHRDSSDSWLVDAMSSTPYWRYEIHYPILSRSSIDPHSPKEPKDPKQPKTVKRLFCQQIVEDRQPFFQILSKFGVSRVSSLVVVGRSKDESIVSIVWSVMISNHGERLTFWNPWRRDHEHRSDSESQTAREYGASIQKLWKCWNHWMDETCFNFRH